MQRMRIFPRDPISVGVLLLVAAAAPTSIAMMLSFRRSLLGQPPLDLAWWISLGFSFPLVYFPLLGLGLIIFGLFRKMWKRARGVA
jgi:hypothetical protein